MNVARVETSSGAFLSGSPLKALANCVYVHKLGWESSAPVLRSLRVNEDLLASIDVGESDRFLANHSSLRVRRFLQGLRTDLHQ